MPPERAAPRTGALATARHVTMPMGPGQAALAAVRGGDYDIVITDVVMPEVNGVAIVKEARARHPSRPIIAISGGSAQMPAAIGLNLSEAHGADRVLYKPFTKADLLAAVEELRARR